jgi:hypothetical protein
MHDMILIMQKKDMYTAVKSHPIDQASTTHQNNNNITPTTTLYRSRTLPKNENNSGKSFSRRRRGHSVVVEPTEIIMTSSNNSNNNNSFKHGLVMRKHVMESTDKRARHRQWQLCYLVMNDTKLIMYRPTHHNLIQQSSYNSNNYDKGEGRRRRRRRSMILWNQSVLSLQDIISEGGGEMEDWKPDEEQPPLGILEMNHTYASAVPPPGWNSQRPHVFRMETADGGLWLFESIDMFNIQAWVEAAHTTAANISKGPVTGAVCNIDYGWGAKWDNSTNTDNVPIWYPPTPCMINSSLNVNDQYNDLESQIKYLHEQLNYHRELKLSLDKRVCSIHTRYYYIVY